MIDEHISDDAERRILQLQRERVAYQRLDITVKAHQVEASNGSEQP